MPNIFYIGAYGEKENIHDFHAALKLPQSEVKVLRSGWHWHSAYNECSSLFPEDELEYFLSGNRELIKKIKKYRSLVERLIGTIVCELGMGERPHGYSISTSLIQILAEIDASLEIDVIIAGPRETSAE